jgi:pimeloyl-ACP methyl ester carboxylesterase
VISDKFTLKELSIQNNKIPVWVYGDLKNKPVFFIHGYFRAYSDYIGDLPVRYLMKRYCVVAFDLPGFGASKGINVSNSDFIETVRKTLFGNKKISLFGVSYGGLVVLKYSYEQVDRVEKIIISGTPFFSGLLLPILFIGRIPLFRFSRIAKEFTFLNKSSLSKIKQPVLLNYSSSDWHANLLMGRSLRKILPNARMYEIKGKNHKWLLHRIDQTGFLKEVENFLES